MCHFNAQYLLCSLVRDHLYVIACKPIITSTHAKYSQMVIRQRRKVRPFAKYVQREDTPSARINGSMEQVKWLDLC